MFSLSALYEYFFGKSPVDQIQAMQDGTAPVQSSQPTSPTELTGQALLDSQGFPKVLADAFDKTAQETNSVIMSRAPGKAVLKLVEHGHDLKCFQIKSKSCDWGPMSGFLCQLTCFNKKGTEKIDYNDGNYVKFFNFMRDKQETDAEFKKAVQAGQTPFIPLKLFDNRKKEVLADASIQSRWDFKTDVVGIASHKKTINGNKEHTVLMEFLLRNTGENAKGEPLWSAYHGRVFFKELDDSGDLKETWSDFFEEQISYLTVDRQGKHVVKSKGKKAGIRVGELLESQPEALVKHEEPIRVDAPVGAAAMLDTQLKALGVDVGSSPVGNFYPIYVAQNPFPPYVEEEDLYKNAVTGDYDLFSVWPVRPGIGWEDLVRLSDLQIQWGDQLGTKQKIKEGLARKESFFVSVPAKPFSLEFKASPDVYVEVIPGFEEIEQWEDPETGNINTAVATAAQTLNSFIFALMLQVAGGTESETKDTKSDEYKKKEEIRRKFSYANVAFHSDEGGRPGIDDIDLPVAVFLPDSVAKKKSTKKWLEPYSLGGDHNRFLVIKEKEYEKFLRLSLALRHKCMLMFNHVWLTYLFALVVSTAKVKTTKETAKYFKAVTKEQKELGQNTLKTIRMLLSALFIGGQLRIEFDDSSTIYWGITAPDNPEEAAAANDSMSELANAFVKAVAKKKAKDKRDMLHKAMIHFPSRDTAPAEKGAQTTAEN